MPQKVRIPLYGQRFGKLLVLNFAFTKYGKAYWRCQCDCGHQTACSSNNLRSGGSKACGKCAHKRHGHTWEGGRTPTYSSWIAMITRCHGTGIPAQAKRLYQDRGITVCKRWRKFENFLADMGERPKGKSIDRLNGNKGYFLANCRWATQSEQTRNTTRNRLYTYKGEILCIAEIAEREGMLDKDLRNLLRRKGMTIEKALTCKLG